MGSCSEPEMQWRLVLNIEVENTAETLTVFIEYSTQA